MDINSILQSVKSTINEPKDTQARLYTEVIKVGQQASIDKEFTLRLVPYTKEGKEGQHKTFAKYIKHGWNRVDNGKFTSVLSPKTYGENCSISDYTFKYKSSHSKADFEALRKKLMYKEGHYVNVYVINDPVNSSNNGKVKILSLGKKMYEYIVNAVRGDLNEKWTKTARQFAPNTPDIDVDKKIFDLSENGVNLVIRVNKNGDGYINYDGSGFEYPDLTDPRQNLSQEDIAKVLDSAFDLTTIERVSTDADNVKWFKRTFLGESTNSDVETTNETPIVINSDSYAGSVDVAVQPMPEIGDLVGQNTGFRGESTTPIKTSDDIDALLATL